MSNEEFILALDELESFKRDVAHADEERDLLAAHLGTRIRIWRGRLERGQVTDGDRWDVAAALQQTRAMGPV